MLDKLDWRIGGMEILVEIIFVTRDFEADIMRSEADHYLLARWDRRSGLMVDADKDASDWLNYGGP
ncbi:MAG: hypothetical protein U5K56_09915 [Halioglobus sp.]|nr:hypothetical protein [Halioglobus sp.]